MAELPTLEGRKQEEQQGAGQEQQQGASREQQPQGARQEQQEGPSQKAALEAVQGLATSLPAGADAAYADAIVAVMPVLRAAAATASSSVVPKPWIAVARG